MASNFLRRLTNLDTIDALVEVGVAQMALIHEMRQDMAAMELGHVRHIRDLVVQFREAMNRPEDEVISGLDAAIVDLNDSVARLEEHVG